MALLCHDHLHLSSAFGKAQTLWRSSLVVPATRTIYVTEGETDAISLVDAGVENDGVETVVVALPGAAIIRADWSALFTGREAILCFDADEAGQQAVEKFAVLLGPHAANVSKFNWNGKEAA